jgi:hypothetical protein
LEYQIQTPIQKKKKKFKEKNKWKNINNQKNKIHTLESTLIDLTFQNVRYINNDSIGSVSKVPKEPSSTKFPFNTIYLIQKKKMSK